MRNGWDYSFILIVLALGAISLLIIFSINKNLALTQLVFWTIGLIIMTAVSFFNFKNWQKLSLPLYLVVLILLALLFFIAEPVRGSTRWIDLGFLRFQPSEIAKVSTILILSGFYLKRSASEIKNIIFSFILILPLFVLVFIQPDMGNSLPILTIWLGISAISGLKFKNIFFLAVICLVLVLTVYKFLVPYQKERLYSFINPQLDPLGTGYSLVQSKIAIGSGQFLGRGLGRGSQSQLEFLPEVESDFVFASTTEQLGFLGAGLVVTLFSLILVRIVSFTKYADRYGQLILVGSLSVLLIQFLINVGMNLGLLPVTGITLPFFSYGGSSLISTLFLMGIVFSIRRLSIEHLGY